MANANAKTLPPEGEEARLNRRITNIKKREFTRQMSAVPGARGRDVDEIMPESKEDKAENLGDYLKTVVPFHDRWDVVDTINEGSFGVVFSVKDVKTGTLGVIKVSKADAIDSVVNATAKWEHFILEKIYKANPDASVARLLDYGMLQGNMNVGLEFMVLEFVEIKMQSHLEEYRDSKARGLRICQLAIMMLKALYDIHAEGLLHRDIKPDNMGLLSREQPILVMYDLGMARMYTDDTGKTRPIRSTVAFRGTPEWASGHALNGREQTRFDDLMAWFYVIVEFFDPNNNSRQTFPWSCRGKGSKETVYFKSRYCPTKFLLRHCPSPFFAINNYLHCANHRCCPDYGFLIDRIKDAMEEIEPGSSDHIDQLAKPLPREKGSAEKSKRTK